MPGWWGRKPTSSRKSDEQHRDGEHARKASKEKARSFDDIFSRNGVKPSALSGHASSSSSGFDSDGVVQKRGHPLPRPSILSAAALAGHDHAPGSGSVSSVSSSGSSDDPPDHGFASPCRFADPMNTTRAKSEKLDSSSQQQQIIESMQHLSVTPFSCHPRHSDLSTSPKGEFVLNGMPRGTSETRYKSRSRSPGPTSSPHSLLSSPLHPRLSGFNPDSPTDRQDDGKTPCHPLPLPPGSPTPSSPSHAFRGNGANENSQSLRSKWKKGKLLGRGTFGHVYVGFNSENGHMCAIKEVRVISDDPNSKESLRQLNQEIALLSQLSHPNIVQYYGSELAEESLSVYLEYVSGGSIHKLLQEYGPFREPVIRSYAGQILSGLAYLHERNTVHRDIKGANILVDPNGEIKLADFGMAKHINSCTNVLSFKGSPYWMAPEVIMNTNGYNLAVDIWSLGCTILEMATSKPPWSRYEGVAAIFKIGNSKDIPEIPEHLSDDGKNFVKLCLQRDPSARPTAAQLVEHPFVRDHAAAKVPRISVMKELHPFGDTGHSPTHTENTQSRDFDYVTKDRVGYPSAFKGSSDGVHARVNLSLPVSPSSSPLRQFGTAGHRNFFLSPPHPEYVTSCFGFDTYPAYPPKNTVSQARRSPNGAYPDIMFKSQTPPGGSPRARDPRSVYL